MRMVELARKRVQALDCIPSRHDLVVEPRVNWTGELVVALHLLPNDLKSLLARKIDRKKSLRAVYESGTVRRTKVELLHAYPDLKHGARARSIGVESHLVDCLELLRLHGSRRRGSAGSWRRP